ncbi:hypothetical protein ACFW04_010960 [Cataglyphis niger]
MLMHNIKMYSPCKNVIWIFSIHKSKSLRTLSNIFILNLAIFNLLMTGYDAYALCNAISGMGQAITDAAIAFNRYRSGRTISCPIDGRLNRKQDMMIVLFTWFWALLFSIMPMTQLWDQYAEGDFLTTCSFDYLTQREHENFCNINIFLDAKKMNVKSFVSNQDKERIVKMRITKAAFTIFFLFYSHGNRTREMFTPLCCQDGICINPWIYAINHLRHRQELDKRYKWTRIR